MSDNNGGSTAADAARPLGIPTLTRDKALLKAVLRQDLHTAAKELLPHDDRLRACFSLRVDQNKAVGLEYDPVNDRARTTNVCRCGNPHICPNCGPIESEEKNQELREDLAVWELAGFAVVAATFTIQHFEWEALSRTDDRLKSAFREMWNSRDGRTFYDKWQISGRRRSPDVTITEANGWHPHFHTLFFLERRTLSPTELAIFETELAGLWQQSAKKAGGFADLEHGCMVKADHIFEIADYITSKTSGIIEDWQAEQHTKAADERLNGDKWGISEELTKSHLKEAARAGLSPNELLLKYLWGDEEMGKLWVEYANCFKGKKFLDTSPGLRKRLGELKAEYHDQLEDLRQSGELKQKPEWGGLAYLGPEAFKLVVNYHLQQWLLYEVRQSKGNASHIKDFLDDHGIYQVFYPSLDEDYPDWWLAPPDTPAEIIADIRELNRFAKDFNNGLV